MHTCSPFKLARASRWFRIEGDTLDISESIFILFFFGSLPSAIHIHREKLRPFTIIHITSKIQITNRKKTICPLLPKKLSWICPCAIICHSPRRMANALLPISEPIQTPH